MHYISAIIGSESACAIFIISAVIILGLFFGEVKIFGVKLGTAGILFAGIIFGHFKITIDPTLQSFLREFGLILFIYSLGLHVGPGFFISLKKAGLKLNLLAVLIVFLGTALTIIYIITGLIPPAAGVGLLSGAVTNTPSLAAIQEAITMMGNYPDEIKKMPILGYAMAYPFGIMGIIFSMLIVKKFFNVSPENESKLFEKELALHTKKLISVNILVEKESLNNVTINELTKDKDIIVSRILKGEDILIAKPETILAINDIIHVVGDPNQIKEFQKLVGSVSAIDLKADVASEIISRWISVTKPDITGKTINEICLSNFNNTITTRISRSGVEFSAAKDIQLQLGDSILLVGKSSEIDQLALTMGNSIHDLRKPNLIPVFIGIIFGVLLGSVPIYLPGIPAPVKLGLAGGPLLAAIFLSRIGRIGKVNWFMAQSANWMLRELGISLFLACVGLRCGDQFVKTITEGNGLLWMFLGMTITLIPLLTAAFIGKKWLKINFLTLCGILAASSTNPPALAFASNQYKSNAISLGYATVYPLVMILRIVAAQIIVILFINLK